LLQAHQLGMYGADYAWILQGAPSDIWWENTTECPQHHLAAAVEGLLLVSSHNSIVGMMPSYSGLVSRCHWLFIVEI
jgi:gamma-aminobutyric acid type B receptor